MKTKNTATFFAILAAALYAVNIPISKIYNNQVVDLKFNSRLAESSISTYYHIYTQ